jgi:hypothetical protein
MLEAAVSGVRAEATRMRAARAKQLLKNGLYRTIGETAATVANGDGYAERALRVLMYHKVNDRPENPLSVPVSLFDEQLAALRRLGDAIGGEAGAALDREAVLMSD